MFAKISCLFKYVYDENENYEVDRAKDYDRYPYVYTVDVYLVRSVDILIFFSKSIFSSISINTWKKFEQLFAGFSGHTQQYSTL